MKKRKWFLRGLVFAACFAGVLAYLWLAPWSNVIRSKYESVQIGMNRKEVQEILGGAISESDRHVWEVKDGCIWLRFDKTGKVSKKEWSSISFWDRFRQRFGL